MDFKTLLTSWYYVGIALLVLAALAAWPRSRQVCWDFLKNWSELLTIPTALVLWGYSDDLLKALDKTSRPYDAGVYQVILFGLISLLFLHGFVRLFLKLQWPTIDGHLDGPQFTTDFKDISPWERIKTSLSVFFGLLFALVLLTRVL